MIRRTICLLILLGAALWPQQPLKFEVATVKRSAPGDRPGSGGGGDQVTYGQFTLVGLIKAAYFYELGPSPRVIGGPAWVDRERFTIQAKSPPNSSRTQIAAMLKALLAERFLLRHHSEDRVEDVYALVPAGTGGKLPEKVKPWDGTCYGRPVDPSEAEVRTARCTSGYRPPGLAVDGGSFTALADFLSSAANSGLDRPVVDRTGVPGRFTFTLEFPFTQPLQDATGPSLFTAIQEQLGLKLEKARAPVPYIVIDSAQLPDEN